MRECLTGARSREGVVGRTHWVSHHGNWADHIFAQRDHTTGPTAMICDDGLKQAQSLLDCSL